MGKQKKEESTCCFEPWVLCSPDADGSSESTDAEKQPTGPYTKDLTGTYTLREMLGDPDGWSVDMQVSWAKRMLAKSINYGVNTFRSEIKQEGDRVELTQSKPLVGSTTRVMYVN